MIDTGLVFTARHGTRSSRATSTAASTVASLPSGYPGLPCTARKTRASPLAALDLPLKILVWDDGGKTKVTYYDPDALNARHHVPAELAGNLAGINALTDALVSS